MPEERKIRKTDNGGVTGSVVANAYRTFKKFDREEADLKARRKAAQKKWEDDGVDTKALKEAAKTAGKDATAEIEHKNKVTSYLKWVKAPIGDHLVHLDEPGEVSTMTEDQLAKRWRQEGFQAGINAANRDTCPHDPNSPAGQEWYAGYEEGQAENASGISDGKGNKVTLPAKRGRGKKNAKADAAPSGEAAGDAPEPASDAAPLPPEDEDVVEGQVVAAGDDAPEPPEDEASDRPQTSDEEWAAAAPQV